MDRIQYIARTGINCFHWDTKSGAARDMRDMAGPALSLMGGVSNYTLLRGTPDDVVAQAEEARGANINIVGPECAIPLRTPLSNLQAITSIRT